MISAVILFAMAYLAGSLNFSILLFKCLGKDDPREHFSKNPGVTNVYRQAGPFWAFLVLSCDLARGVLTALAAVHMAGGQMAPWAGLGLILGNSLPCFHGFGGGKGVAGYLGFGTGLAPLWALMAVLAWVAVFILSKTPFIASFFMILILGIGVLLNSGSGPVPATVTVLTVLFIIFRHRDNLKRIIKDDR